MIEPAWRQEARTIVPIPIVILRDKGVEPAAYRADNLRQAALLEPPSGRVHRHEHASRRTDGAL